MTHFTSILRDDSGIEFARVTNYAGLDRVEVSLADDYPPFTSAQAARLARHISAAAHDADPAERFPLAF